MPRCAVALHTVRMVKQGRMEQAAVVQNYADFYREAFARFGAIALWNVRHLPDPQPEDALAITRALRTEGNLDARRLAERIERACRAAH